MNYDILWRNRSRNCIIANVTIVKMKRKSRDLLRTPFPRVRQKLTSSSVFTTFSTFPSANNFQTRIFRDMTNGRLAYRATRGHSYPPERRSILLTHKLSFESDSARCTIRSEYQSGENFIASVFSRKQDVHKSPTTTTRETTESIVDTCRRESFFPCRLTRGTIRRGYRKSRDSDTQRAGFIANNFAGIRRAAYLKRRWAIGKIRIITRNSARFVRKQNN